MRHSISFIKVGIFSFILLTTMGSKSQTIDQFDTSYNAGLSARTLPGYSWYQTFTAGTTGNLSRIDIGFYNYISGTGTLEVYEDTGITGNMIYSSQENVFCPGNGCMIPFHVNCNVVVGSRYTFHFIPGIGIPDPFGVQQDIMNNYTGGEMYDVDPGGVVQFFMDLVFVTYVKPATTELTEATINQNSLFHISGSSVILDENISGELFSIDGQKVQLTNLANGVYVLRINYASKNYVRKICIR